VRSYHSGSGFYGERLYVPRETAHANENVRVFDLVFRKGTDKVDGHFFKQSVLAQRSALLARGARCRSVLLAVNAAFNEFSYVTAHAGPLVARGLKCPHGPMDAVMPFSVVVE
jgi:hypothetical protein